MRPRYGLASALLVLASVMVSVAAKAQLPSPCRQKVTRDTVVACALASSPAVRGERYAMDAARGRQIAAGILLPSNPVLSLGAASRAATSMPNAFNWSGTLSQEVEIGGQRGARIDVARAEIEAQSKRIAALEQETAAAALIAYFEALSARDELALADRLAGTAKTLEVFANARAEQGLAAPIEADVAYAVSIRLVQAKAAAERRASGALAALAAAVGLDPTKEIVAVEGELVPLPVPEGAPSRLAEQAAAARSEIASAKAEGVANERRVALLRRARIPNLTLSAFLQNDGFNERVLGGGISVPIPLPGPLGRTNAGEIAEATALSRRAGTEVERIERRVRLEVTTAAQAFASRRRELEAFDPKRLARAEDGLRSLGQEITTGRLAIRDAVLSQQALIELLQAYLEAKRALCIASVELARAAGAPLERGAP